MTGCQHLTMSNTGCEKRAYNDFLLKFLLLTAEPSDSCLNFTLCYLNSDIQSDVAAPLLAVKILYHTYKQQFFLYTAISSIDQWFVMMQKWFSLVSTYLNQKRLCKGNTLWRDWKFHSLQWLKFTLYSLRFYLYKWFSLLVDWNVNLFDWPKESLQGGLTFSLFWI